MAQDMEQLRLKYDNLGQLVARQQEMIDGLLAAHEELMQAHVQLERGHETSRFFHDALHDCLCARNVLTRGEVRHRANYRSRISELLQGIDLATLNGFTSPADAHAASASSVGDWEDNFLAHRVLVALEPLNASCTLDEQEKAAVAVSDPIVDVQHEQSSSSASSYRMPPPKPCDIDNTAEETFASIRSIMSSRGFGAEENTQSTFNCVARRFAKAVHRSEEKEPEVNWPGVVAESSQAVSPLGLARNRTQLQLQTQQRVLDWQLAAGGYGCDADDSDDVEVLKAKLRKVCRINVNFKDRLAQEKEKVKKYQQAGEELQDAFEAQARELTENRSNIAYWQHIAEERNLSRRQGRSDEVGEPFLLECWRTGPDSLCKSVTPTSAGESCGPLSVEVYSAQTACTTPLQGRQQARSVRAGTTRGASGAVVEMGDDHSVNKKANVPQGLVRESVRHLPTPARSRNAADSINSWPGESTKKTAGRAPNRRACHTSSSSGKNTLFGRLPAPPPVAPPAAQPHPADRRQRGTVAVEFSDSDTQSCTDGKARVADLASFWESQQQQQRRHRTSSDGCADGAGSLGGTRERRNTWTGAMGKAALACMERPKVDREGEQRFDTEVQQRFDMAVDPDQLEVGVDEVINAEVGGDDVGDVAVPHAVPQPSYLRVNAFRKRGNP